MAKKPTRQKQKKSRSAPTMAMAAAAGAAAAAAIPEVRLPPGGTLDVLVDVGPMTIDYTIAYAGEHLFSSLVDSSHPVPLVSGTRFLAWHFEHTQKNWTHTIGVSVNQGAVQVLESRSEANKDSDSSIGFAVIVS